MQFQTNALPCLKRLKREVQTQEQTQELRLPDGLPDAGRILGAWGQVILRSKEWHTGNAGASGGVMAWVLYAPEDGSAPRSVEVWIPFQMKWDIPDTDRDGTLCVHALLRALDARMLSARKLLVRAGISVQAEAMLPGMVEISQPPELPGDLQLLKNIYPIRIPREAGEKPFSIDEELTVPTSVQEIISCQFLPVITDSKVMAGRVVFRGTGMLRVLYQSADGRLQSWETELPFSQFTDLEQEYSGDGQVQITPILTGLELDKAEDGHLHFNAGITCQYCVSDRSDVEIVEDAYSPHREVTVELAPLQIPVVLDQQSRNIYARQSADVQGNSVADVTFFPDHPRTVRDEGGSAAELNGQFQMLYYDENDMLQSVMPRWENLEDVSADPGCRVETTLHMSGMPTGNMTAGQGSMQAELCLETETVAEQGLSMVVAIEMGELREPDPDRPSLIIRKVGDADLWEIARSAGSTVDAIRKANPSDGGEYLLIPIE